MTKLNIGFDNAAVKQSKKTVKLIKAMQEWEPGLKQDNEELLLVVSCCAEIIGVALRCMKK